jgi:hypothetical protein
VGTGTFDGRVKLASKPSGGMYVLLPVAFLQDFTSCVPFQLNSISMSDTTKKLPDFQQAIFHGRIAYMEVATHEDREFLVVTLAHTMSENTDVRVKFTNSNGLLTAYRNGNLVVGQELTASGTLKGIRSFYMKDDVLTPLKNPELQLRCTGYVFGSKPQSIKDQAPAKSITQPEPTLEEVAF